MAQDLYVYLQYPYSDSVKYLFRHVNGWCVETRDFEMKVSVSVFCDKVILNELW